MKNLDLTAARFRGLPRHSHGPVDLPVAGRPLIRLLGLALLDADQAWPGLFIPRCRSIHSFGMRFPMRVYFLDRAGRPLHRIESLPPGRVAGCMRAHSVVELVPEGEL